MEDPGHRKPVLIFRMGWVNPESERMTEIKFPPWVGFEPTTSWSTVQRFTIELSSLSYHRSHNHDLSTNIFLIRIFDLQKVGHGHEQQRRQMRRWMTFFVAYKMVKNGEFISSRFSLVHQRDTYRHTHTHTRTHTVTHTHLR